MIEIHGINDLRSRAGSELGVSGWVTLTQSDVDKFADLTGDHQWIHVDVERATASSFGGPIVHGYFTLALLPQLNSTIYKIDGFGFALNYGVNKIRFPAPLPVGGSVRLSARLNEVTDVGGGGVQVLVGATFERKGFDKPVCVAETVTRYYPV